MRVMAAAALVALLGACAPVERETTTGQREPISLRDEGDECGASLVATYVGLNATDQVKRDVAARSQAKSLRWIGPNDAVTMDYRPDRLNANLDANGRIVRLSCG